MTPVVRNQLCSKQQRYFQSQICLLLLLLHYLRSVCVSDVGSTCAGRNTVALALINAEGPAEQGSLSDPRGCSFLVFPVVQADQ